MVKVIVLIVHLGGQMYGIESWNALPGARGDCARLAKEISRTNHVKTECRVEMWPEGVTKLGM